MFASAILLVSAKYRHFNKPPFGDNSLKYITTQFNKVDFLPLHLQASITQANRFENEGKVGSLANVFRKFLNRRMSYDIMRMRKAITKGRSDREVREHHHGECRAPIKRKAYKHGKTRRYDGVSISIYLGVFKLIVTVVTTVFYVKTLKMLF